MLIVAFPRTPIYGGYPLEQAESFRRAKSEWVFEFPPGHWALGLQKLPLLRFHSCAWVVQTNVPGSVSAVGAGVLTRPPWQFPCLFVGATLAVARKPSPSKGADEGGHQELPILFTGVGTSTRRFSILIRFGRRNNLRTGMK